MNRDARIAFVTNCLPLGGSTTFVLNLGEELLRRGWELRVWRFDPRHPLGQAFERAGIDVRLINQDNLILEDRAQITLAELRDFAPSIVISNLGSDAFEILRYLPEGILRIGMAHTDDPMVYKLHARCASALDICVGVSRLVSKTLAEQEGIVDEQARLIEYGVRFPAQARADRDSGSAPLRIIYLGRLDQDQKRVRLFPQILRELIRAGIAFEWTLAGDGPERSFLEKEMAISAPNAVVRFAGQVNPRDVPDLLSQHDVFLLASDFEGLPLSLLESMGAGLVPVVSDLPSGIRDLVNEDCGFRIDPSDTPGYATALASLANDPTTRQRMAANARDRVLRDYSVEAMADRWETLFNEVELRPAAWPSSFRIEPPFGAKRPGYYRGLCRILRRFAKKLRR